jgi:hypothetical protein
MYHLRQRSDNFFFKTNNPVFAKEGVATPDAAPEDPAALEYMKSMERKYEPRKMRKTQNAYVRMEAVQGIRNSLAQVSIEDLVEFCILSPSTFDLAMLLHKYCGDRYRCIDMVHQKWQSKHRNEWSDSATCINELKQIMTNDLTVLFRKKMDSVRALLDNKYISGEIAKPLELKSKNLEYIFMRLGALNIKNLIMKDATEIFFYSEIFDAPAEK